MSGREPKRFWYILGACLCAAIIGAGLRGRLGLFIHPRYHGFTIVMAVAGTVTLLLAAKRYQYGSQTVVSYGSYGELIQKFLFWLFGKGAWLVVLAVFLLAWLPAEPLLSNAANRKLLNSSNQLNFETIRASSWFADPESLYQFSQVLRTPEGFERLENRQVKLSGFVQENKNGDANTFLLSRFTIACCAVDATPASVVVFSPGWQKSFPVDSWVEVEGIFERSILSTGLEVVLSGKVTQIEQPREPYDFL